VRDKCKFCSLAFFGIRTPHKLSLTPPYLMFTCRSRFYPLLLILFTVRLSIFPRRLRRWNSAPPSLPRTFPNAISLDSAVEKTASEFSIRTRAFLPCSSAERFMTFQDSSEKNRRSPRLRAACFILFFFSYQTFLHPRSGVTRCSFNPIRPACNIPSPALGVHASHPQ